MTAYNDEWFLDHLKQQTIINDSKEAFVKIHGVDKRPEIALDVLNQNINEEHVKQCAAALAGLESVMPADFAQLVRACAVVYANFCDDVFAGLEEFYYQGIALEWLLHSEASFDAKGRYRDHLTHQLKVSLLGLEFLKGTTTGVPFIDQVKNAIKDSKSLDRFLTAQGIKEDLIDESIVTSSWLLASLFHDIGYCFLMQIKTAKKLKKISSLFESKFADNLWAKVKDELKEESYIISFFREHGDGLTAETPLEDVKGLIYKAAFESKNHSVVGALYLIYMLSTMKLKMGSGLTENADFNKKIALVFELAEVAVLTHDLDAPKKQILTDETTRAESSLFKPGFKISFKEYPLSYLLGVCDQLQDWGRIRIKRVPQEHGNILEKHLIDCTQVEIKLTNRKLQVFFSLDPLTEQDFIPSFAVWGAQIKKGKYETNVGLDTLMLELPEGRFSILNKVYVDCPQWDQVSIFLKVGGVVYTAADFIPNPELKQALHQTYY